MPENAAGTRSSRYQIAIVTLLSFNFGIVFFDRNALNFLMPFVQPELGLSNTQIGMLASALSVTWAVSAFGIGRLSDFLGRRKILLVLATFAFSACSFLSGLASSFAFLLGTRLLMGVAEGGIMPLSHAIILSEVAPKRRGLAQGVAQSLGSSLLGSTAAPLVLVALAETFGWRSAFYLSGIPGLLAAVLLWFVIEEPVRSKEVRKRVKADLSTLGVLTQRNILVCVLLGILSASYLVVCWVFMPIYLVQVRHYSPETMSWLMGTLGISAAIASFLIPGLSDAIGRRPVIVVMPLFGLLLPLAAMFYHGPPWALAACFFLSWTVTGIMPIFMATVPCETVDPKYVATALGLTLGLADLGGIFAPSLAGMAADASGPAAPLWIMFGLAVAISCVAIFIRETAPQKLAVTHRATQA